MIRLDLFINSSSALLALFSMPAFNLTPRFDKGYRSLFADICVVTRFYLSYKYRTLKTAATNDAPAEWNSWIEVYENIISTVFNAGIQSHTPFRQGI